MVGYGLLMSSVFLDVFCGGSVYENLIKVIKMSLRALLEGILGAYLEGGVYFYTYIMKHFKGRIIIMS